MQKISFLANITYLYLDVYNKIETRYLALLSRKLYILGFFCNKTEITNSL
jgi:hypothetical protein